MKTVAMRKREAILKIFQRHMDAAVEEVAETEIVDFFWTENTAVRLANMATDCIVMLQETEEYRKSECGVTT